MEDLRKWLKDRDVLVKSVEMAFIASGCTTYPTVREMATKLRMSMKRVHDLADDAKEQGDLEINVAVGNRGGVALLAKADWMLEPCTEAADTAARSLMRI
jgi:hypothetical protein